MSIPDRKSKISLEDLLRLKRAERPDPEFWTHFERELRQKQLTALVQKRRWWHQLPMVVNRRISIPAGAAAIVVLSLVSARYSNPTQIAQQPGIAPQNITAAPTVEILPAMVVGQSITNRSSIPVETEALVSNRAAESMPTKVEAVPDSSLPSEAPPPRALVAALSPLQLPDSEQIDVTFSNRLNIPIRVELPSVASSEVASMTPASSGRYQLIARYAERSLRPAPAAPAVVRERLARRLGDDLGDSISRIGVVGSKVSLKF